MKCDELKRYEVRADYDAGTIAVPCENDKYGKYMLAEDVIAAIAELKDKCNMHDFFWDGCGFAKMGFKNAIAVAEYIDELQSENRKLKRALWLARAKRAEARKNYWYVRSVHEGDKNLWSIDGSAVKYIGCIKRTNFDWLKIWSEVESKCLAKAEQYKEEK